MCTLTLLSDPFLLLDDGIWEKYSCKKSDKGVIEERSELRIRSRSEKEMKVGRTKNKSEEEDERRKE